MGYRPACRLFSAAEVSAPHRRLRVFILAARSDLFLADGVGPRLERYASEAGPTPAPGEGSLDWWPSLPGQRQFWWESSRKEVHEAVKRCEWEALNIRPKRSRVQVARFHLCDQIDAGERLSLAVSDCAQARESSLDSETKSLVSGTKGEMCNWEGRSHIRPEGVRRPRRRLRLWPP